MIDVNFFKTTHEGGYADIVEFIKKKGGKRRNKKMEDALNSDFPHGVVANLLQSLLVEMGYGHCMLPSKEWRKPCSEWVKGEVPKTLVQVEPGHWVTNEEEDES